MIGFKLKCQLWLRKTYERYKYQEHLKGKEIMNLEKFKSTNKMTYESVLLKKMLMLRNIIENLALM